MPYHFPDVICSPLATGTCLVRQSNRRDPIRIRFALTIMCIAAVGCRASYPDIVGEYCGSIGEERLFLDVKPGGKYLGWWVEINGFAVERKWTCCRSASGQWVAKFENLGGRDMEFVVLDGARKLDLISTDVIGGLVKQRHLLTR